MVSLQVRERNASVRAGDEHKAKIGYRVDEIYRRREELLVKPAKARVLVDGEMAAEVKRPVASCSSSDGSVPPHTPASIALLSRTRF
jgi:hypothetical protein